MIAQIICLDTKVVGWFATHAGGREAFANMMRSRGLRVTCSVQLLFELANNPDTSAAVRRLELLADIVDWDLFTLEPKQLIIGELQYALQGVPHSPYFARAKAQVAFRRILADVREERVASIREWSKARNKGFFLSERGTHDEIERMPEASRLDPTSPFSSTMSLFLKTGLLAKLLRDFAVRYLSRAVSPEDIATIFRRIPSLPVIDTLLMHCVAYFHYRHVLKRRPFKSGSNMDARHILGASFADSFLSNDGELLELLSIAGNSWRFKAERPQRFLILPS